MLLTERYADQINGVYSCYDRVVIQGTLPVFCYAEGMTSYLYANNIRIFDYAKFAEPLRDELRANAEQVAKNNNLQIDFIRKKNFRKEQRVREIVEKRGNHSGLVHIFSAMEPCPSYKPWHDKNTHKTFLKFTQGKCLHYYFYLIDDLLGLCYVRVPTWCPFRLQIYFNGHNQLASALNKQSVSFIQIDNMFVDFASFEQAQAINDQLTIDEIHKKLDKFAEQFCPVIKKLEQHYHWSIMQVEYATDIVFKRQQDLQSIYDQLVATAIHTVKPDNIASFLGKKLHPNFQGEMGNNFNTRIEGTRIKHTMGPVSIKMYDKLGLVLRIETTVNNVSFFKHYRKVEHRDGTESRKLAPMKKGIYSLTPLRDLLSAANHRYLQFVSAIDDMTADVKKVTLLSKRIVENERSYKGFNFFSDEDQKLFEIISRGEFNISGFQNKNIRQYLTDKNSGQVSRILKRLHVHGLIKKIGHTYKYYLTKFGRQVILMGLKLKELVVIPGIAVPVL
ncbi:MAG TPA: MarR family transcriptional regulator [Desulfobulbus sp.]|nr:MarR family transcriptional regulator [Desulfobulbus sp.]